MHTPIITLLVAASAVGAAGSPSEARHIQLFASDGWEVAGDAEHDLLGTVVLSLKEVDGTRCLRGSATVAADASTMLAVVQDIAGALSWSTAGLTDTRVLGQQGAEVEYLQVLDVPDWTMASDRFWVLRGTTTAAAGGQVSFVWDRFDWPTAYPELATELARTLPKAVEPDPNFGAWAFTPTEGGAALDYYLCTESGSLPYWLQKAAATKTLPAAMADVVREARKRDG